MPCGGSGGCSWGEIWAAGTSLVSAAKAGMRQQNASTRANRMRVNEGLRQGPSAPVGMTNSRAAAHLGGISEPEVYRTSTGRRARAFHFYAARSVTSGVAVLYAAAVKML